MSTPEPKVLSVVGARPNFMKVAPVHRALREYGGISSRITHTGQHYDRAMSDVFFEDLELPPPDICLGVGSGTHAEQTSAIMKAFEKTALEERPDLVLVYGDVNSTMAAALVSAKLGIKCGHVEAGLRSGDRSMPEEINRIVTDAVADLLYVSEPSGMSNLRAEGVAERRIVHVGNVMIDTLARGLERAKAREMPRRLGLAPRRYVLVTLHRPSNVDNAERLDVILETLRWIGELQPVVFPVHPRTQKVIEAAGLQGAVGNDGRVRLMEPLGYLDFLGLMQGAAAVVTDSGGIQEETTYLGIPCVTLRKTTERPVTVTVGTNEVVGEDPLRARDAVRRALEGSWKPATIPALWDGHAGERIARHVVAALS